MSDAGLFRGAATSPTSGLLANWLASRPDCFQEAASAAGVSSAARAVLAARMSRAW